MKTLIPLALSLTLTALGLSGCLIVHETPVKADPKVDPRLEGVWQFTPKAPDEIRSDRDRDNIGASGYIIFAKVDDQTYKVVCFDRFEKDSPSKLPDMLVGTRNYKGHCFLLARLPDYEKEKAKKKGEKSLQNWLLDYEVNKRGELLLRFLFIEDFEELQKAHPIKFDHDKAAFSPVTLKGSEEKILGLYTDPKVRALLTSAGKYQRLQPPSK